MASLLNNPISCFSQENKDTISYMYRSGFMLHYVYRQDNRPLTTNNSTRVLKKDSTSDNISEDIILHSIELMKSSTTPIIINNIFFDFNESELKPESFPELNRLSKFLLDMSDVVVEISGHTDNIDSDSYNNSLSLNRAGAVVDYLVSKGCNPSNIKAKGYGSLNPIADNDTEEGRSRNRRVEMKFLL